MVAYTSDSALAQQSYRVKVTIYNVTLKVELPDKPVSGESGDNVVSREGFKIKVTALNKQGQVTTDYRGKVHFETGDKAASMPSDYTFTASDAGVHVFEGAILKTVSGVSSTRRITVTDASDSSISGDVSPFVWFRVLATREGLVGQKTANGHIIVANDHFVALPSRAALNSSVRIVSAAAKAETTVQDVGPHFTTDPYWQTSGRPKAETDSPTNTAGIDIADGTFAALGLNGMGSVVWRFK